MWEKGEGGGGEVAHDGVMETKKKFKEVGGGREETKF